MPAFRDQLGSPDALCLQSHGIQEQDDSLSGGDRGGWEAVYGLFQEARPKVKKTGRFSSRSNTEP